MPLTDSLPHQFDQYRAPGGIAVIQAYKPPRCRSHCPVLTRSRPTPVLSCNPLQRVLQSEFPRRPSKVPVMAKERIDFNTDIPTAASRWRKETLNLLNVDYNRFEVTPFEFGGLRIPDDMENSMSCPLSTILSTEINTVAAWRSEQV